MIRMIVAAITLTAQLATGQHAMQHGFILGPDEMTASHLVANNHHSRQVVVQGELVLRTSDQAIYAAARLEPRHYLAIQAQDVNLETVSVGDSLRGAIFRSPLGSYTPGDVLIEEASFEVNHVGLNVANPFFAEQPNRCVAAGASCSSDFDCCESLQCRPSRLGRLHCSRDHR